MTPAAIKPQVVQQNEHQHRCSLKAHCWETGSSTFLRHQLENPSGDETEEQINAITDTSNKRAFN